MIAPVRIIARWARLAVFSVWFAGQVVLAAVEVAVDVVTPRSRLATGILAYRLQSRTRGEVATFAALVNLTPGTLTLAVRDGEPATVYVHAMYAPDRDDLEAALRHLETRYLSAVRGRRTP